MQLGPGEAVDGQLERVGGLALVGLPVHDQPAAVRLDVDRVDATAHHLAGQHHGEGRLDGARHPLGERAGLEAWRSAPAARPRRRCRGHPGRAGRRGPGVTAGRSAPRPRRGTGCRSGQLATACAASASPAPGRTARGRRAAGPPQWPTGCSAAAPRRPRCGRPAPRRARRSSSASHWATVELSTRSRCSPRGRARVPPGVQGGHRLAHQLGCDKAALVLLGADQRRPRFRGRVLLQRVGGPVLRQRRPRVRLRPPAGHRVPHGQQVRRGRQRLLSRRAPLVRRDPQLVLGPGERDVAEPELLDLLVRLRARLQLVDRGLVVATQLWHVGGVAAQRRRQHPGHSRPLTSRGGDRELLRTHTDQEHRGPLQALGAVDGEQLDRVGLRRRGLVETAAHLVLGLEPGQQRRQSHPAVDRLELRHCLHEQVEVVAPRGRGQARRTRPARRRCRSRR